MRDDMPIYIFTTVLVVLICYFLFKGLAYGQVSEYDRAENWLEMDSQYLVFYGDTERPNYIINKYDISYINYGVEKKINTWFIVIYLTRGKTFRYEYNNYYIYEREMKKLLGANK